MCYDAVPMQNIYGDVCHLLLQITSSKLSKSFLAKYRMESLVYTYMLARYTLQVFIVIKHLKYYNNFVLFIIY